LQVAAVEPSGVYTAWATNTFTNNLAYQGAVDSYDNAGNITNRVWRNPSGGVERTQTLSWDARGRLHAVTERDANTNGYNWTATYDGLNRRLSTTSVLVTNGVAFTGSPSTINSYYDPQAEFLELGVAYGPTTEWKLYGPDLNGVYGGMNGTGGFEAVSPYLDLFEPVISDFRGNVLGVVTNGVVGWNPARPTGFGAVPGYRPPALGSGASIALSSAWRGRWADITGYYSIGLRPYDPVSGRWLGFDSVWNGGDPNAYSFCGGDPVNGFDSDGRCVMGGGAALGSAVTGTVNLAVDSLAALSYAVTSPFAPDWAYQSYGGNVQRFANTVTGTAQFGYDLAATATYGAISPFAPDFAYNNYGGNVQQLMGQAPALYGGNDQSTAYKIGYASVNLVTLLLGGEEGEMGDLGSASQISSDSSVVTDSARLLPAAETGGGRLVQGEFDFVNDLNAQRQGYGPLPAGEQPYQLTLFPDKPYNRVDFHGNTPTSAQRAATAPYSFDHDPALVQHYWEGNGQGGLPGFNLTQTERLQQSQSLNGKLVPRSMQNYQGWLMKNYSIQKNLEFGF
jgi:RHS repeat-associated protein